MHAQTAADAPQQDEPRQRDLKIDLAVACDTCERTQRGGVRGTMRLSDDYAVRTMPSLPAERREWQAKVIGLKVCSCDGREVMVTNGGSSTKCP